jgi:hypothetical protein
VNANGDRRFRWWQGGRKSAGSGEAGIRERQETTSEHVVRLESRHLGQRTTNARRRAHRDGLPLGGRLRSLDFIRIAGAFSAQDRDRSGLLAKRLGLTLELAG